MPFPAVLPIQVDFGPEFTGLAGTITAEFFDSSAASLGVASAAGIAEVDEGAYIRDASIPANAVLVEWSTAGADPVFAHDSLVLLEAVAT
ncbi:MAG: hypothetical protein V3V10_06830 [Planctomycetota bacterium]